MAQVIMGMGTSHTPMNSMPPEYWGVHGEMFDKRSKELISLRSHTPVPYEELEAEADLELGRRCGSLRSPGL